MELKPATIEDFDFFYGLKCEDFNISWTGHAEKPQKVVLYSFFKKCISNFDKKYARKIYIIYLNDGLRIGHIYIDALDGNVSMCAFSIAIASCFSGHGYAKQALSVSVELAKSLGFVGCSQYVREDNVASLKAFAFNRILSTGLHIERYIPKLGKNVKMLLLERIF